MPNLKHLLDDLEDLCIEPETMEITVERPASAPESPPSREQQRRLVINIKQTDDTDDDIARLNNIIGILKSYPGRDEVHLNVLNGEGAVRLSLPNIRTDYDSQLQQQLVELVDEDGLNLETIS